jgi:hypothetical protein
VKPVKIYALLTAIITLRYISIAQAARDNNLSRVWSGWDFRKAASDGEEMGRRIGRYVFENKFREN